MNRSIRRIAGELASARPMPSMYAEDWPNRPRAGSVARKMEGAHSWLKGVAQKLLRISERQWISATVPPDSDRVVLLEWKYLDEYHLNLSRYRDGRWVDYEWVSTGDMEIPKYWEPIRWREIDWEHDDAV